MLKFLAIMFITMSLTSQGRTTEVECVKSLFATPLEKQSPQRTLRPELRQFLEKALWPLLNKEQIRSVAQLTELFSECGSNCIQLAIANQATLKILVDETLTSGLQLETSKTERILHVPKKLNWTKNLGAIEREGLIKSWLVGSPLHPQIFKGKSRILRMSQRDALQKLKTIQANGGNSFFYIAPTGTGKTEVLTQFLLRNLNRNGKTLSMVIADSNDLTYQLTTELSQALGNSAVVERWGDGTKGQIGDLPMEKRETPKVLVTTIHTLKNALRADPHGIKTLASQLAFLGYDEAHHAGAFQTVRTLREIQMHQADYNFFMYGTSATPLHRSEPILEIFGGVAFWAYLDSPTTDSQRDNSNLVDIVEQLKRATDLGELTPFGRIYLLHPTQLGNDLYISAESLGLDSTRYVLNPNLVGQLVQHVIPLIQRHQSGFLSVSTIAEATSLAQELNHAFRQLGSSTSFQVLHSKLPKKIRSSIISRARQGEVNFLVTVRQLDEGLDFPRMSLYIDLNHSVTPRQFLQRAGRVKRLAIGKYNAEVLTTIDVSEEQISDSILLLGQLAKLTSRKNEEQPKDSPSTKFFLDKDYETALESLKTKLVESWKSKSRLTLEETAEQINVFVEKNGMLPRLNHALERGTRVRFRYFFEKDPDGLFNLLSSQAQLLTLKWYGSLLNRWGLHYPNSIESAALLINFYFEGLEWYEEAISNLESALALPPLKPFRWSNIHMVATLAYRKFGPDLFNYVGERAQMEIRNEAEHTLRSELPKDEFETLSQSIEILQAILKQSGRWPSAKAHGKLLSQMRVSVLKGSEDVRWHLYWTLDEAHRSLYLEWIENVALQMRGDKYDMAQTYKTMEKWNFLVHWLLEIRNPGITGPELQRLKSKLLGKTLKENWLYAEEHYDGMRQSYRWLLDIIKDQE